MTNTVAETVVQLTFKVSGTLSLQLRDQDGNDQIIDL